jgi:opacity protein-like surface antigen
MINKLPVLAFTLLFATPLAAQNWSIGAGTGPFVFGDFWQRTTRTGTETSSSTATIVLSGAVRPGLSVDVQNDFADRWGIRAEAAFAESKLKLKNRGSSGVNLDGGKLDVTTLTLPLVFHINPHGTFRFDLFGGPAYAMYHMRNNGDAPAQFSGTRNRAGWVAGGGVAWWLSDRFAVEGSAEDIVTSSPFERSDFPASTTGLKIKRPNNVHTTVGIRWRL